MNPKSLKMTSALLLPLVASLSCRSLSGGGSDRGGNYGGVGDLLPSTPAVIIDKVKTSGPSESETDILLDPLHRGLGDGYDSQKRIKLAPCIDSSHYLYRGANTSDLSFMRDYSYDQIMNEVGAAIYAKANVFGLVSVKVQGDMAISLATTDDAAAFIYNFRILGKSAVIDSRTFNNKGSSAFNTNDLTQFREQCGDQFVEQVKLGAQLFVGLKYTFANKEIKEKVMLTLKGSLLWGLIKYSKTWTKEFRQLMQNVRVTVEAFQIGGDPSQLERLKKDIRQGSCAGDNAETCSDAIDRLLEYGRTGFTAQVTDMKMEEDGGKGLAIVDLTTDFYSSQKILNPSNGKLVKVNIKDSTSAVDDYAAVMEQIAKIKSNLKIALGRIAVLEEFNLNDDERRTVMSARNDIQAVLAHAKNLANTTCADAKNDFTRLKSCAAQAGLLENDSNRVSQPIALHPIIIPIE